MLFTVLCELGGELGQCPQRGAEHLDRLAIAEHLGVGGRDQRIGRLHHPLAVGLRHPEHVRDRLQREPLGYQIDEVATAGRGRILDDQLRIDTDAALDPGDLTRRERGGDETAELAVARRVHRQERLRSLEHLRRRVRELHTIAGAEALGVTRDTPDVLVADDRPVVHPALIGQTQNVL